MKRDLVLSICGVSKDRYYGYTKGGKVGAKQSTKTIKITDKGELIQCPNELVVDEIVEIKLDPETDYGYRAMTAALMLLGYVINHKKVYRLMREYQLLHSRIKRPSRNYVQYRRVTPERPLEILEMDIKFQWVCEHARFAYILTIIDTFDRNTLGWTVAYSIKKEQVKALWDEVIVHHLQPADLLHKGLSVEIRNDNDSRFAAKTVQKYFADNHLNQVFTHPYTPQENGHIESFHAILGRSLARHEFRTISDLEKHLKHFYHCYNNKRIHGSLDHLTPNLFAILWRKQLIDRTVNKKMQNVFKLKIPHYLLLGNGQLREVSSLPALAGNKSSIFKEVNGAITLQQPLVQRQHRSYPAKQSYTDNKFKST
ncbi:integrase core domain-containing protein [Chitinophagales bacterium]|nr:integrase core domain-containing protein [Chitinophagales bacterium]